MASEMSHQTVVIQCSNDIDIDLLFKAIEQGTDGVNQTSYLLNAYGQKTIEKALPVLTHEFDVMGVTDDDD